MSCECGSCVPSQTICVPKGDDQTIVFTVREDSCEGDLFDISGATEIVFIVADVLGGTVQITKKLSDDDIEISTNDHQFYLTVTSAETAALTRTNSYFEVRITTSEGYNKTVVTGVFKAQDTMIKDI